MNKTAKRTMAVVLAFLLTFNSLESVSAAETDETIVNDTANAITDVTGINDVNTDIYSTKDSALVADGYEMLLDVPQSSKEAILMSDGLGKDIYFHLPQDAKNMESALTEDGTLIYDDNKSDVSFGIQPLQVTGNNQTVMEGVRTTIVIDNDSAPKSYSFSYDLNDGERIVSSAEYLGKEYDTGELYIVNEENEIMYIIDKPWAKDANGNSLNTFYTIDGNNIYQTVDFDKNTAFPVVADPSVWQITKCVGSIAWVVGTTIFAATKLVKIKKYVKELGGIKNTAQLLIGATSVTEKSTAVAKTLLTLAATISGIDSVYKNCKLGSAINIIKKRLGI